MTPEQKFSKEFKAAALRQCPTSAMITRIESSLTCPGLPDWLIILPGGTHIWVELKVAPNGLLPAQRAVLRRLHNLNVNQFVLKKYANYVMLEDIRFETLDEAVRALIGE